MLSGAAFFNQGMVYILLFATAHTTYYFTWAITCYLLTGYFLLPAKPQFSDS